MYVGAILRNWRELELRPGSYVILLGDSARAASIRSAEWHLRDTLSIVRPGPSLSYAFLFRRAPEGTVAENVVRHGTGALNIDACRVSTQDKYNRAPASSGGISGRQSDVANLGRWPTNLVLVHGNCISKGTKKIPGHKGYPNGPGGKSHHYSSNKRGSEVRPNAWAGHADADGMETIDEWDCAPDCPVGRLNKQSGVRPATLTGRADPNTIHSNPSLAYKPGIFGISGMCYVYADSGGAARYYVQATSDEDVLDWFRKLITPPEGEIYVSV